MTAALGKMAYDEDKSSYSGFDLIWSGKKPDAVLSGPTADIVFEGSPKAGTDFTGLAGTDGTMEAAAS